MLKSLQRLNSYIAIFCCGYLTSVLPVYALESPVSQPFAVTATLTNGCILGSGATDAATFGTINFGNLSSLFSNVDVISTPNSGTIVLKCTPNTQVTVSLDNGLNSAGGVGAGRYMKRVGGTETLKYQLYQNSGLSTIWGNGTNGGSFMTFTADGTVQQWTIYARLFSMVALPTAGQYSDTVTVSVIY